MAVAIGRKIERQTEIPAQNYAATSSATFAEKYPSLQKFLAEKRKSPNQHKTGSVTLFVESGGYKLCLNDRPRARSTFVAAPSLGIAFAIADTGLERNTLDWRTKGYKSPK
ncbi:unnamed protein product [marine sediment metagenome]|uniref:Uncharacterized protein n=1 Tax=marine sediment metagenome TaxID=412755 RepID=X1HA03_9ZZZZ